MNKILLLFLQAAVSAASEVVLRRLEDCAKCQQEAEVAEQNTIAAISGLIEQTIDELPGIPVIVKMLLKNKALIDGMARMLDDYANKLVAQAIHVVDGARQV